MRPIRLLRIITIVSSIAISAATLAAFSTDATCKPRVVVTADNNVEGTIKIMAPGHANVFIDGIKIGKGPLTVVDNPGKHDIVLTNIVKNSVATKTIWLNKGETLSILFDVNNPAANKENGWEICDDRTSCEGFAPQADQANEDPIAPQLPATNKVSFKAKPWGVVTIDQVRTGNTPRNNKLSRGEHLIQISYPAKNIVATRVIKLKDNENISLSVNFDDMSAPENNAWKFGPPKTSGSKTIVSSEDENSLPAGKRTPLNADERPHDAYSQTGDLKKGTNRSNDSYKFGLLL